MASAILHIKDAYYFEVPRALKKSNHKEILDFPEHYVRLDSDYQAWEADRQYEGLAKLESLENLPPKQQLISRWEGWQHDHANFAKPFDRFLEEATSQTWFQTQVSAPPEPKQLPNEADADYEARLEVWKTEAEKAENLQHQWTNVKTEAESVEEYAK